MTVYLQRTSFRGHFYLKHEDSKTSIDYWVFPHKSGNLSLFTVCKDKLLVDKHTYFSFHAAEDDAKNLGREEGKSLADSFKTEFIDQTQ